MQKIASPTELQNGLRAILAYSQGTSPARGKIVSDLRRLARGVLGTSKVAAGKTWGVQALQWMSWFEGELADVIQASKGFEVTKTDGPRSYEGRGWTRLLIGETSQGIANAKTVVFWDDGHVVVHVNYHIGSDLTALFGSHGEDVDFDDNPNVVLSKVKKFFDDL
jgi:hypothetical protein